MAYQEVHMTEIKEILLRAAKGFSIRSISKTLNTQKNHKRLYKLI